MSPPQPRKDLLVLLIVVFLVFVAVISTAGYKFYQNQKRQLLREEIEAIQTVANLKVNQIERWRQERLADAQVMADNPFLVEHVRHLIEHPEELPCRANFQKWLRNIKDRYHYANILLLNNRGEILLKAEDDPQALSPSSKKLINEVIEHPRVLFSDFYPGAAPHSIRLSVLTPIVEQQDGKTLLLGIILFRIDPEEFLFPLIQSWPTTSPSAETMLVRREGDELVFLNDLRHRQDTALELRVPLDKADIPAVQAALGREGIVWGKDYRGVPVLAVIRRIVDSPWILVSKMDEGEIYAELQDYALWTGGLVLGLSLIVGLICIMLWRRQQTHYLRDLALQETEQKQKLDDILSATPDQMYLVDREGRCLFANRAAVQTLGLDYPELLGHSLRDRGLPAGVGEMLTAAAGAVSTSGETRSGEISFALGAEKRFFDYIVTPLMAGAGTQPAVLATFRDITDRKLAEDRLSCLNHLYAALSRAGDVMLKERHPQKLQEEFCRIAVEEGGLRFAWVGRVEPENPGVEPAAFWGFEEGYLEAMDLATAAAPDSPCPFGIAIRAGDTGLYQNLEDYAHTARCYQEGLARGFRSLGVFPLRIGERLAGAMSFYSALPDFFTPDKVELLERLTSHLALALEMAAREEERRQAEHTQRSTSEFLDSILQHTPVPMYVTHRDGHYLLVNPAWEGFCHKNRDEALGRSAADIFQTDNAQSFMETDQRVLRRGKPLMFEEALKVRGKVYYFQTIKFPLHNDQGEIEAVGGISIDITERRQAEEALRHSEERYRGIFENAPVGMFQSTLEGRYLAINPAMAEMLGYGSSREVMAGVQSIAHDIYVHPEQRVDILRRFQAGEGVVKTEIPFRRRNGEVRTANAYFRVIREQGKAVHLEGFVEDITERKKAEDNLVAEKQFSDKAIDSLPGLFYLFDDQGHLLRWNRNFEEVSGYAPDELLGMKPQDFLLGQERQEALDAIEEARLTGEAFLKADFITKDGRAIPHFFTGRPALIGGKPCLVGTGIDVSELRRAEAALALHNLRLNTMLELHRLADAPREELLNFALYAALGFMESEFGWIGLVDEDEQGLTVHAWSTEAMAQCRVAEKTVHFPITPEAGLWAECLRQRQAVMTNDYQAPHDGKRGLPEGHVPISRFVAVPVFDGSRLVAAAAVANKAADYTQEDVRAFTALLNKLWELLRRREMEQALRDSEAKYRNIVETALEGVWVLDAKGHTSYVNHRMAEMLGYEPDQMLGRPLFDFMDEDNRRLAEALWAERRQGNDDIHEFCFQRRDGAPLWTIVSSRPLTSDTGAFLGAFAMITDITARKRAEEALRDSEEKYRLLVKNIPAVVARGYKDWSVDVFDEKIEALTGYPLEAFNSRQLSWEELILPEDLPRAKRIFLTAMKSRTPYVREYRIRTRSGDLRWLQERSQMIFDESGVLKYVIGVLFDITERQQAEEALRASEERYRTLVENINLGISLHDADYRIIMTNAAMARLFHKDPQEFVGQECFREYEKREAVCPHCPGREAMATGLPARVEAEGVRDDGSRFVVSLHAFPLRDPDGRVTGFVEMVEDITERKQAEAALWESRELLQAVLDNIPARVFWKDTDLRYLGCNPLFAQDAGFEKPEELLGKDDFAMTWRDQAELYRSDDRAIIDSGEPRLLFEEPQTTPSGGQIELLTSKVPLRDAQGAIVGVLGTYLDVTERKRAAEAVRESEESLRQILEMLPVGVWVADHNGVIIQGNPAARSIWGGARFVGPKGYGEYQAWWRSTGEPIQPEDLALARAITQGETSLNEVIDIEAFDGTRKIILNSALPLKNARGEIIKAIAVNQDITERIEFEERLKASLREKEVLLKEVHHRVKNNMQIISSLLRLQSDRVSQPEVHGVFQESQNRIRSMALVHEMLYQSPDLASISFGAYLKNLVNGLFRSFRVDTHQIALTLEVVDIPLGIDLALSCGLIINELVSNSLKHAFPQNRRGELSISARQISPEELMIAVRDTGVGLPPDLDIRKTSSLGLRLVTLLVGQINGSLELDSAQGATFLIRFPVKNNHG